MSRCWITTSAARYDVRGFNTSDLVGCSWQTVIHLQYPSFIDCIVTRLTCDLKPNFTVKLARVTVPLAVGRSSLRYLHLHRHQQFNDAPIFYYLCYSDLLFGYCFQRCTATIFLPSNQETTASRSDCNQQRTTVSTSRFEPRKTRHVIPSTGHRFLINLPT